MRYLRTASEITCHLCLCLFSTAVFLLWGSLAAAAGYVLLQLPDVWAMHSNDLNGRYAVMSVTAYALIVGVLFLVFVAGSVERLCGAIKLARVAIGLLRETRRARAGHAGNATTHDAVVAHPVREALRRWMFS
jgi:hypothetical protein